jgi:hypothetical protein
MSLVLLLSICFSNSLTRLTGQASSYDFPTSASRVVELTGMHYHAWP